MGFPIAAAISLGGSLFGGTDKTPGRNKSTDEYFQRALNGDAEAEKILRCRAGDARYDGQYGGKCGVPQPALDYAKGKVLELEARRKLAPIIDTVGKVAGQVSDAAPYVAQQLDPRRAASYLPYILGAVGLVALVLMVASARRK